MKTTNCPLSSLRSSPIGHFEDLGIATKSSLREHLIPSNDEPLPLNLHCPRCSFSPVSVGTIGRRELNISR
jgi:hypothetical protein